MIPEKAPPTVRAPNVTAFKIFDKDAISAPPAFVFEQRIILKGEEGLTPKPYRN